MLLQREKIKFKNNEILPKKEVLALERFKIEWRKLFCTSRERDWYEADS